jgi:hypothetical protein
MSSNERGLVLKEFLGTPLEGSPRLTHVHCVITTVHHTLGYSKVIFENEKKLLIGFISLADHIWDPAPLQGFQGKSRPCKKRK